MTRIEKAFGLISIVALMAAYIWIATRTADLALRVPSWDEASHGFDGVAFADAFRHLSPLRFLKQLQLSAYWPPVYPLVESAAFLLFGPKLIVGRTLTILLAALNFGMLYLVARATRCRYPSLIATFTSAMLFLAPYYQQHSLVCMLEVPGVLVALLGTWLMARYLNEPTSSRWKAVCIASAVIFFTKYNYGIMWIGTLVIWMLIEHRATLRRLPRLLWRVVRTIKHRHPYVLFVYAYVLFLAYINISGGGDYQIMGQNVELTDIWGNPLYILVFLVLVGGFVVQRRDAAALVRAIWNAPEPWRGMIRWIATPILIWFISPQNFSTFLNAVINDSKRESVSQIFTYYPRVMMHDYAALPAFGAIALVALLIAVIAAKWLPRYLQFIVLYTTLSYTAVAIHPNIMARYLFTVAPFIYLVMAMTLTYLLQRLSSKKEVVGTVVATAGVIAIAGLTLAQAPNVHAAMDQVLTEESGDLKLNPLLDAICQGIADAETPSMIGFNAHISPSTLAWHCYGMAEHPDLARLPQTLNRRGLDPKRMNADEIVQSAKIDRMVQLEYKDPAMYNPTYVYDTDYYPQIAAALEKSPAYQRRSLQDFPDLKLAVAIYVRK